VQVVHLADGRGQQAAEGAGERGGREEEGEALLGLVAAVPAREQEEAAREHDRLEHAEEEAGGEQAGVVLHDALQGRDGAEADAADRQPDAGREVLEQDVGGDLAEDVGDEEDDQGRVVLRAVHVEVLLEAEGARVGDVDAVQEGQEVEDDHEGDEVQVDPHRDLALGGVRRADDLDRRDGGGVIWGCAILNDRGCAGGVPLAVLLVRCYGELDGLILCERMNRLKG